MSASKKMNRLPQYLTQQNMKFLLWKQLSEPTIDESSDEYCRVRTILDHTFSPGGSSSAVIITGPEESGKVSFLDSILNRYRPIDEEGDESENDDDDERTLLDDSCTEIESSLKRIRSPGSVEDNFDYSDGNEENWGMTYAPATPFASSSSSSSLAPTEATHGSIDDSAFTISTSTTAKKEKKPVTMALDEVTPSRPRKRKRATKQLKVIRVRGSVDCTEQAALLAIVNQIANTSANTLNFSSNMESLETLFRNSRFACEPTVIVSKWRCIYIYFISRS